MDWLQLLINLVVTGILLYVFQRMIDERSAKRLEKFKAELQSTTFEKEIKFSKLHETRMQVLAELYKRVSRIDKQLLSLKINIEFDKDVQDEIEKFNVSIDDFQAYFDENRLSLPERLCTKLYAFYAYSIGAWSNLSTGYITKDYAKRVKEDREFNMEDAKQSLLRGSFENK